MMDFMREFARYWSANEIAKRIGRWAIRRHHPVEMAPGEAVCVACRRPFGRPPAWPCAEFLRLDKHLDSLER